MWGEAGEEGGENVWLPTRAETVLDGGVVALLTRCLTRVALISKVGDFCCRSKTRRDLRGE